MKKLKGIICTLLIICSTQVVGQTVSPYTLTTDWYFGQAGRLVFPSGSFPNSTAPTPLYNSASASSTYIENSTSLTFPDYSVALYSNAKNVYNGSSVLPGDFIRDLQADNTCATSSTGAAVSFPDPASPTNAFYMVTTNDITGGLCVDGGTNLYRFTGTGTNVTYNSGPTLLATNANVNEAITSGADGTGGYWVVVHDKTISNQFRLWHFTSTGRTGPVLFDKTDLNEVATLQSYLKFSPCMDKIAFVGGKNILVYNFDKNTGTIGSEIYRNTLLYTGYGGLEFSPDGNTLYYARLGAIVNYVILSSGVSGTITGSQSWSMQLGTDGNVYTSPDNSTSVGKLTNTNTPLSASYQTVALPGGAKIIAGITNLSWLNPNTPTLSATVGANCSTYVHTIAFNNYFNIPVSINTSSIEYSINGGAWIALPANEYTSPASVSYTIRARFNDAYCGQQWITPTINVTPSCPTPVTLIEYYAKRLNNGNVGVYWTTANEQNSSHFVIQRSFDLVSFENIGQVTAAGNSTQVINYQFIDHNAPPVQIYYRIVEIDNDDTHTNFNILSINGDTNNQITVYPNPFQGQFIMNISNAKNFELMITDIIGRILYQETIDSDLFIRKLGDLFPSGTYIVSIRSNEGILNQKMIKKD
jgi:hypothetical protein